MEDFLTQTTDYLLTQSWQIAILVVAIGVATLALKNRSAHVRYLLWLIVLAKCLMPPLFAIPLPVLPPEKSAESVPVFSTHIPTLDFEVHYAAVPESPPLVLDSVPALTVPVGRETPPQPVVRQRLTIQQWLGVSWIIGVAVFFFVAVIKALRTDLCLRRQRKPLAAKLQIGIESEFASLGFRPFPKVWLVEGRGQPFVWGLLRGSIYLPADFVGVDRAEYRRDVLGHELSHVLRFDAAVNILQMIAQTIFWFHPFVWWANRRIRAEREKCCDEMAIASLGAEARDYSSAIVEILVSEHRQNRPVPSLAVAGSVRNVEERIKTMMTPGRKFYKRPSLVAATVALLLALLTAPTAFVLTARAQTEAAPEHEEAPAHDAHAEHAEREIDERRVREERRREEVIEVRRSRRREEMSHDPSRRRDELQERAGQIERELEGLQDGEDERARDLQNELREIREEMRSLEREFADRAPERRRIVSRERRDVNTRELMAKRRRLEEQAHRVEDEIAELLQEGKEEEVERRKGALEEIHEGIRQIDEQLNEAGQRRRKLGERGRPGPEARRAELMRERGELEERAGHIERELKELGDREEAQELRGELNEIERRIFEIDRQLRGPEREPERREKTRLEAPGGDLERQVRQLRGEVMELRHEMRELRELLHQLLGREPRTRERQHQREEGAERERIESRMSN